MAHGARFALAASNPPPPRGRSRRRGAARRVRWWTCAPAVEGGKSCKKNPRHSLRQPHRSYFSHSLFLALSAASYTLPSSSFSRSTPAGNRRLYLSTGHAVAPRPPPFALARSLARSLLSRSPFSPASSFFVPILYPRAFKRDVCMYGLVYAAFMWNSWGEHRERRLITRCQRNARRSRVCV